MHWDNLRHLVPIPSTDPDKRRRGKLSKKAPKNFIGRGKNEILRPDLAHPGPDPIRQSSFNAPNQIPVEPIVNVPGLFDSFGSPHDPSGDIGKDHYVQAINATTIGIYDKAGNILNSFSANTLWSSLGFTSAGDPIVLYDQEADRWIITEFPNPNQLLVAVSENSDPLGSWNAWNFATPSFPDYPKYGIWSNAYSVTTNEGGPGVLHAYFINREALLNGNTMVPIQRIELPGNTNTEAGFFVGTPVDWSGLNRPNSDPIILALNDSSWGSTPEDAIEVFSVNIDWNTPSNTVVTNTTVLTSPYDSYACAVPGFGFSCIPQPNNATGLDGIPEVIMNQAHYRNFGSFETMVFNFMTDVDGNELSGIRWVELRKTPGNDWTLFQEGTFAPNDGINRFMGGIAMDGNGNIGLAYSVSGPNTYPGIRFTGRRASDPLGEMTVDEYVVTEGQNVINSGGRFGDYAHMSIDPTNDRTFWFTTEYATNGNSRTQILAFELNRDTTDIGPTRLLTPSDASDLTDSEVVSIEVKNFGLDTVTNFEVGYSFEGGAALIDPVAFTLYPDSVYTHTFTPTVDMQTIGEYQFLVFTNLLGDQSILNDTIRPIVSKLPRWDVGISEITGGDGIICADSVDLNVTLSNYGTATITSATIQVNLNGSLVQTFDWTGTLPMGQFTSVPINVTGLNDGNNTVNINTLNPNGETDQNMANDSYSRSVEALLNGVSVSLRLLTDDYPTETTWELSDANGQVLFSGGSYNDLGTLYIEEWCLDPNACYKFTIFDSEGDGICCNYGLGNYSIVDASGNALLSSTGEFGSVESSDFCATFSCMLSANADVSPESITNAADGVIMVTASNGTEPYEYSIDGGSTFQSSNVFSGLSTGTYSVMIKDQNACEVNIQVTVPLEMTTSTSTLLPNEVFQAFPNPTSGVFQVQASGLTYESVFIPMAVYDSKGKLVYESRITKYDEQFTGMFSLYAFPAGVYYVKFFDEEISTLLRIVKQ